MSTISEALAKRNMAGGTGIRDTLSLESAAVDARDEVVGHIEGLHEIAAQIAKEGEDITTGTLLADNIDTLVDNTIQAYKEGGVDERGADLLEVSIECLIRATNLPLHYRAVVPSFESVARREDYSTEAEKKKDGFLARLFAMLREALARLGSIVRSFVARMRKTSGSLESYIKSVKARADRLQGASKGGKVKIAQQVAWNMIDFGGHLLKPAEAIDRNTTAYARFVAQVQNDLGKVTQVGKLSTTPTDADVDKWVKDQAEGLGGHYTTGMPHLVNVAFLPTWKFNIKHTAGVGREHGANIKNNPLIGAKAEVFMEHQGTTPTEADALTVAEIHATVDKALHALSNIQQVEKKIDAWVTNSDTAVRILSNISKFLESKEIKMPGHDDTVRAIKSLMAANNLYSQAYTLTLPHVITMIRTNVSFADRCISLISHGELKEVNANQHKLLGHSPAAKAEPEHEYAHFEPVH